MQILLEIIFYHLIQTSQPFFNNSYVHATIFLDAFLEANGSLIFIRNIWHWRPIGAIDHWFIPMAYLAYEMDRTKWKAKIAITQVPALGESWEKKTNQTNNK